MGFESFSWSTQDGELHLERAGHFPDAAQASTDQQW